MSRPIELLALRKEVLVARSSLCRLKIRRDVGLVRESVSLPAVGAGLAGSVPVGEMVLAFLLPRLGAGRIARVVALASGAIAVARIVVAAIGSARPPPPPAT